MKIPLLLCALALFCAAAPADAGSATWKSEAASSDWNTPANWTPVTVPDGPGDVATFATSSQTLVEIPTATEVDSIVFQPGADAFTIVQEFSDAAENRFSFSGAGIVNNSGLVQNFIASARPGPTSFLFYNTASAGRLSNFLLEPSDIGASEIEFYDFSSAGSAVILNEGGQNPGGGGAGTLFFASSTAASSTITANGGTQPDAGAGVIGFGDSSTADHSLLIANGTAVTGTYGGWINFSDQADMGAATIIVNGSPAERSGDVVDLDARAGLISFIGNSTGGTARVKLFGNAVMDVTFHTTFGLQIGSLEGEGSVFLRRNLLGVGTNNLSTTFSGRILQNGQPRIGGAIEKVGTGTWTLSGANTYTAGTTVSDGFLKVSNTTGSATGGGVVQINGGTLGGGGIISGPVTVGSGSGSGAFLAPGTGAATLTLQSNLTFKIDGTYVWRFTTRSAKADKVIANGVIIESGAQFDAIAKGNAQLPLGSAFVAISNTAATAISGTFSNLPDGSTVTVGVNKFQADYQGGDGNDLTLTVVP